MELVTGICLLAAAVATVIVLLITAPPRVPLERRRPQRSGAGPASRQGTLLTRYAGAVVDIVERHLARGRVALFNAELLESASIKTSQSHFIIIIAGASVATAIAGLVVGGPLLAVVVFLSVPVLANTVVSQRGDKRRAAFAAQLGDTLQLLSGSLRAGHSILRAIDAAAAESPSPTGEEMRRVVSETSVGRDLLASLNDTSARMRNEDFMWIAQAIQINREVGGNLAEVLDQVGETIRERSEIRGQIKALAAEGKFSAYILMAMPVVIVVMLMVVNPGYMSLLFTEPLGWAMIGASAILLTIGGLWLRKIIDLKF